jgi:hypothetical protein
MSIQILEEFSHILASDLLDFSVNLLIHVDFAQLISVHVFCLSEFQASLLGSFQLCLCHLTITGDFLCNKVLELIHESWLF